MLNECAVDSCKRGRAGANRYCGSHHGLNMRYGTPTPNFTCKACFIEYPYRGKEFNSSWYCPSCYGWYQKLKRSAPEGGGNFFTLHSLTFGNYLELYVAQGGSCKLCGYCPENNRDLHIDHDHKCCPAGRFTKQSCGKCVRGLLCADCNKMLGFYENHRGSLVLDVFDKYLADDTFFVFTLNVESGELDHTKKYRDPKNVSVRPKG